MPFAEGYLLSFNNAEGYLCEVAIYDRETYTEDAISTDFISLNDPLNKAPFAAATLSIDDKNEDKFTPVKSKRLTIRFYSRNEVSLVNFANGADDRWYVEAKLTATGYTFFVGHLVMDDLREPFLPKETYYVTLTATDGLNGLSSVPMADSSGNNPRGLFTPIQYLIWCLAKTGHNLPIYLNNNITPITEATVKSFYGVDYLWSKSFEENINTSINCLDAIRNIIAEECFLTQENGRWYIMRIDEYETNNARIETWVNGVQTGSISYDTAKLIGFDEQMHLRDAVTEVGLIRPRKSVIETYPFNLPLEIIDNIDFERGSILSDTPTEKTFTLADWRFKSGQLNALSNSTATVYIKKLYEDGYEKERYLVVESGPANWIECNAVPLSEKDKAVVSIDSRSTIDISSGNVIATIAVTLAGVDGSSWIYGGRPAAGSISAVPYAWRPLTNNIDQQNRIYTLWNAKDRNEREWITIAGDIAPLPVSGNLYVYIPVIGGEAHFSNLQFDYLPYINGTYQKFRAQQTTITQEGGNKAVRDEEVKLSNSPKKLFKYGLFKANGWETVYTVGALFTASNKSVALVQDVTNRVSTGQKIQISGTASNNGVFTVTSVEQVGGGFSNIYVSETIIDESDLSTTIQVQKFDSAGLYYNGAVFPTLPAAEYQHPFRYLQAFDVWNQSNRVFRVFEIKVQGINSSTTPPSVINKFIITDTTEHTEDKYFLLLHFDLDLKTCVWTGYLAEVFDSTIPKDYDSEETFKYISER